MVSIIGAGWVGKAMKSLFPEALVRDPILENSASKEDVNGCDVAFVCVPTPCIKEGILDTSIVEKVVAWCAWAETIGYDPKITRALLEKNKEWITN